MRVLRVSASLTAIIMSILCYTSVVALDKSAEEQITQLHKQLMQHKLSTLDVAQTKGLVSRCIQAPSADDTGLAWDGQHLWVASGPISITESGTIFQVDPADGQVVASFSSPGPGPRDLTFDGLHLWNVDFLDDRIYQINRSNGSVVRSIPAPEGITSGLTWDGNTLWLTESSEDNVIHQINPEDGTILQSFRAPNNQASLSTLAWDGAHLWFGSPFDNGIYKLDPEDGDEFAFVLYQPLARGLTFDGTFLWANTFTPDICQLAVDTSPGKSLTILPPPGKLVLSQHFDLVLFVKAEGVSVGGMTATLDNTDMTVVLNDCLINGTLNTRPGLTLRCPDFTGESLGVGTHTLSVILDLSDGSSVSDTVTWKVFENTEP